MDVVDLRSLQEVDSSFVPNDLLKVTIFNFRLTLKSKSDKALEASFGSDGRVIVSSEPLRVDVFSGDSLVFSANARGLMKFEHYRHREQNKYVHFMN